MQNNYGARGVACDSRHSLGERFPPAFLLTAAFRWPANMRQFQFQSRQHKHRHQQWEVDQQQNLKPITPKKSMEIWSMLNYKALETLILKTLDIYFTWSDWSIARLLWVAFPLNFLWIYSLIQKKLLQGKRPKSNRSTYRQQCHILLATLLCKILWIYNLMQEEINERTDKAQLNDVFLPPRCLQGQGSQRMH